MWCDRVKNPRPTQTKTFHRVSHTTSEIWNENDFFYSRKREEKFFHVEPLSTLSRIRIAKSHATRCEKSENGTEQFSICVSSTKGASKSSLPEKMFRYQSHQRNFLRASFIKAHSRERLGVPKKEGNLLNEQKGNQSSNVSFPMVALSRDSTVEIRLPLNCSLMCRHLKFYAASRLSSPPSSFRWRAVRGKYRKCNVMESHNMPHWALTQMTGCDVDEAASHFKLGQTC